GPGIGGEKTVIVEISRVGQKIEPGIGQAWPRARHHREERQGQNDDAAERGPVAAREPQTRRRERGKPQHGKAEPRSPQARLRREAPKRQDKDGGAPAGDERCLRRGAAAARETAKADENETGEGRAHPTGEVERRRNEKAERRNHEGNRAAAATR